MNIYELSFGNDVTLNAKEQGSIWKVANVNLHGVSDSIAGPFSLDKGAGVRIVREGCSPFHCAVEHQTGEVYCLHPYIITPEWLDSVSILRVSNEWLLWEDKESGNNFCLAQDEYSSHIYFPNSINKAFGKPFRYRHEVQNQYTLFAKKPLEVRKD